MPIFSNRTKFNEKMYANYAADLFSNAIGTKAPIIKISDKLVQARFDEIADNSYLLKLNYNLVSELSLNGKMVLGLIVPNKIPKLVLINPIKLNFDIDDKLVYLYGNIINFETGDNNTFIKKSVAPQNDFKYTFGYFQVREVAKELQIPFTQLYDRLPFEVIGNDVKSRKDLYNVDQQLIRDLNTHLDLLNTDSLTAKNLFHVSIQQADSVHGNTDALYKAIYDPNNAVFENKNLFSLLLSGGLQIQQGMSNHVSLLEKIKFYDNKIRDFAFLPRNTLDAGTKNIHNAEASSINSNFDDNLEHKANLLELSWERFIKNIFFDFLKNNEIEKFSNLDFSTVKVDVEIAGSTKYLKNRENEYVQNQQGTLINPNRNNQNTSEQKGGDE